jgi:hypothetical protein
MLAFVSFAPALDSNPVFAVRGRALRRTHPLHHVFDRAFLVCASFGGLAARSTSLVLGVEERITADRNVRMALVIARAGVASTASTRTVFDTNAGLKTSVTGPVNVRQEGEEPGDDDYCVEARLCSSPCRASRRAL